MILLALLLLVSTPASAGGPIYRCGPGDYADNCDRPSPGPSVARYTIEQWYERTRGAVACPPHMLRRLMTGELVCEVPQARTVQPEKDDRLLEAGT